MNNLDIKLFERETYKKNIVCWTKIKRKSFFSDLGSSTEHEKCAQYWPTAVGSSTQFGNIEVTNTKETAITELTSTTLRILQFKGKRVK